MRRWISHSGRFLWGRILLPVWRFLGRMGLALRRLLHLFLWLPLFYLTMPLWLPLLWLWEPVQPQLVHLWRFLGRVGLALRRLLSVLMWRPFFLLIIRPFRTLLLHILWPLLRAAGRRLGATARTTAQRFWQITAPRRHLWRRRVRSRRLVWQSRLQLWRKRPSLPAAVEIAPHVPRQRAANVRLLRLATAFATVAVGLIVGLISLQDRQPVAADNSIFSLPQIIILTPTPRPETPTPQPTIEVVLTPWATPDPTTGGGAFVFSQHVNGNTDLYVLPVGQTEPVRLTSHPAVDRDPTWSPDGSRIAFSSNRDGSWNVYVYDFRRGALNRVTQDTAYEANPAWSPDGQWLAYERYDNDNLDIYLVKVDGSQGPLRLTNDPAPDFAPAWEPVHGRHIAFTSWRGGNADIYLRSLDDPLGERVINVSNTPDRHEDHAAFAPNGRFLAYAQADSDLDLLYVAPLSDDLLSVGAPRSLGQQGTDPAWSPDNAAVVSVFARSGRSFLVAGSVDAWGVAPQLYAAPGQISSPSWTAVNLTVEMRAALHDIDRRADEPLFVEALAETAADADPPFLLFRLPVSAPSPYLSDRVDQSFLALRERMMAEAGWDVLGSLEGMFTALEERPLPGQTAQSWSKAGRAFDLPYREALSLDPRIELVREDAGTETYWRLYVRAAVQDGAMGEPLRRLPWDFRARSGDDPSYYDQGGKLRDAIPAGYYVDFTAIAADYGWQRVAAGPNWRTFFPDIRFWRYENHQGLTWEAAMRELYTAQELGSVRGP